MHLRDYTWMQGEGKRIKANQRFMERMVNYSTFSLLVGCQMKAPVLLQILEGFR